MRVEENIRGMIKNLKKEIAGFEERLIGARHSDNGHQQIYLEDSISAHQELIARLEKALS